MSEKVEKILSDLLEEAKRETLFTVTLERDRLISALYNAGLAIGYAWTGYLTVAPLAMGSLTFSVPSGYVAVIQKFRFDVSIPWYMVLASFYDTPITGTPAIYDPSHPPHVEFEFPYLWPVFQYGIDTWTNNHATENNRGHNVATMALMKRDVWDMVKAVYLDPLVEYVRKKASEVSGIPAP